MDQHKDMYRVFWIVKGYIPTEENARACYDSYCRRIWHNEESWIHEEGFEEAYRVHFAHK